LIEVATCFPIKGELPGIWSVLSVPNPIGIRFENTIRQLDLRVFQDRMA
jgi:hypothetical protein